MSPDEVLDLARRGAALSCKEALFTLGDRPEDRWPEAASWLEERGYASTLEYLRAVAILVLEETGLLPHLNPGVMSWEEMNRSQAGGSLNGHDARDRQRAVVSGARPAHFGSPDKDPAVRIRVLEDAGRLSIPFTTGLLLGIGETLPERAEGIFELRRITRAYGAIQEVIVQNFRAKPDTALRHRNDLALDEYLAAIATARILLGPRMRVQAPPNLVTLMRSAFCSPLASTTSEASARSPRTTSTPNVPCPDRHLARALYRSGIRPERTTHRAPRVSRRALDRPSAQEPHHCTS